MLQQSHSLIIMLLVGGKIFHFTMVHLNIAAVTTDDVL